MSIWTRINPNDRDTWPRPGNLVLVVNDHGAAFKLRSFSYMEEDGGLRGFPCRRRSRRTTPTQEPHVTGALYAYADPPYLGCGNLYAAQMSEVYL